MSALLRLIARNLSQVEVLIMNPDEHFAPRERVRSCDSTAGIITYTYFVMDQEEAAGSAAGSETPPRYSFEHDRENGVYRVKWSDGEVEVFRDKPVRHLVVEPDRQTGELRPAITRGNPRYLYLCREEREIR
jgi:hypothetical protein